MTETYVVPNVSPLKRPVTIQPTKFWFVWCKRNGPPKSRHATFESAFAEANRLAGKKPGFKFIILEAMSKHFIDRPEDEPDFGEPVSLARRPEMAE